MRIGLLITLCLLTYDLLGQNQVTKDSLANEICKTINENPTETDSVRVYSAYEKHLYPFLEKFPEDKQDEIAESIYYRLQALCGTFQEILMRESTPNEEWEQLIDRPKTFPNKKTCRDIIKSRDYYYIESTGDTVKLNINKVYWTDMFQDGTYSKLKIYWLTDCEFEIEFIESNNTIRKNLSKKGDRYKYYVIDKGHNYFYLAVEMPQIDKLLGFKIYY